MQRGHGKIGPGGRPGACRDQPGCFRHLGAQLAARLEVPSPAPPAPATDSPQSSSAPQPAAIPKGTHASQRAQPRSGAQ
eukprot:2319634-Rhodomonas_salina.1